MVKKVLSVVLAMVLLLSVFVVGASAAAKKTCPANCEFVCVECAGDYSATEVQELVAEMFEKNPAKATELIKAFYSEYYGFVGKIINFLMFTHPVLTMVAEPLVYALLIFVGPAAVFLNLMF